MLGLLLYSRLLLCSGTALCFRGFLSGAGEPWVILWSTETATALMLPEWLCFGNSLCKENCNRTMYSAGPLPPRLHHQIALPDFSIRYPLLAIPSSVLFPASRASSSFQGEFVQWKLCFNLCWIYPDASISRRLTWVSGLLRARSLGLLIWKWFIWNWKGKKPLKLLCLNCLWLRSGTGSQSYLWSGACVIGFRLLCGTLCLF